MARKERPLDDEAAQEVREAARAEDARLQEEGLSIIQQQLRDAYTSGTSDELSPDRLASKQDME
ncbi:hypothetical protein [Alicyclobacillus shizuokensis]|uniref:hypothetical protein n=1 Tax=Alicyclobacillus shizuokensis TaxID=392014 RepID=UPI000831F398|nr:hypothetical protein [Alicyclobacillus shizuokensis]